MSNAAILQKYLQVSGQVVPFGEHMVEGVRDISDQARNYDGGDIHIIGAGVQSDDVLKGMCDRFNAHGIAAEFQIDGLGVHKAVVRPDEDFSAKIQKLSESVGLTRA